ncbi:hypothetical protein FH972_005673 [Carpinus fangiana]|uniref:TF-B3 domain-containing protein n=1 Tax=Carpinus fangiana TaxID=176857 RepID=A0A5N6QQC0_9ROSI|nr:hypothetical protein FH972_005673 [Carpinus fangiana]
MIITLEDLRGGSPALCGNFNKIRREVIRAVGENETRKPKRQRKNPTKIKQVVPDQPPCMPTEFKDRIMGLQGSDIKLVIQKVLTDTDMKGSRERLSIPRGQMRYDFLSREEQLSIEKKEADGKHFKGMEVPLLESGLQEWSIFLKKWKLGSSCSYMLSNPWINIATRNGLKLGNNVQLWSFRVNQRPHLALIKLQN